MRRDLWDSFLELLQIYCIKFIELSMLMNFKNENFYKIITMDFVVDTNNLNLSNQNIKKLYLYKKILSVFDDRNVIVSFIVILTFGLGRQS